MSSAAAAFVLSSYSVDAELWMCLSGTVNLFSMHGWASSQRTGLHTWDIQHIFNFGISVPL